MRTLTRALLVPLVALAALCGPLPAHAQSVDLGADLMSRYVWRGADFGESMSIQPSLSLSAGGFTIGSWGAYAINPQSAGANEHDLWVSYAVETSGGTIEAGVTDYYFPNAGVGFFNFENDGAGGHQIEPYLSYTGPDPFPISLYGGVFVYNEPGRSVYLEASYPFQVESVDLAVAVGGTPAESAFYGTRQAGLINMSLTAAERIPITDAFSLPVQISYVLNPYAEKTFFVFGVSL